MFGLLKLLAYGLLGYAIYEFVRGVTNAVEAAPVPATPPKRQVSGKSTRQNITGPGRGVSIATQDENGGSARRTVGRGVVS